MTWLKKHKQQELERLQTKTQEQLIEEVFLLQEQLRNTRGKSLDIINKLCNCLKGFYEAVKADKEKTCERCIWRAEKLHKEAEAYIKGLFDDTLKTLQARKSEEE